MEGSVQQRRLVEAGIPISMESPINAFAQGSGVEGSKSGHLIPREKWAAELRAMAEEEVEFWKGSCVPVRLMVELPFWLLIPNGDVALTYEATTIRAKVRGNYIGVYDGPFFFDCQCNLVFLGPEDDLRSQETLPPRVVAIGAPIRRVMRTVIIFDVRAMDSAVSAIEDYSPPSPEDRSEVRQVSRANHYLTSLAYGHIPLLNRLITDYRLASSDPFAFQVSQWDVPLWFFEHDGNFIRVNLMPYWESVGYPKLEGFTTGDQWSFYSTDFDSLEASASKDVTPGTMEMLNARSLLFRGHVDDAIRSAVTAIEVALEGQITKILRKKGWSNEEIVKQLSKTWNDFDRRLNDYERISETRIPGPILSCFPHINGIRLQSEFRTVRQLRHQIVHEGLRLDSESRGPMIRAIETTMWLFHWLSWEEGKAQDQSQNYVFFEMMRGMGVPQYRIDYRSDGVTVLPHDDTKDQTTDANDLLRSQYFETVAPERCDIELFALMSLNYLGISAQDTPPPSKNTPVFERFLISHGDLQAVVFCLQCDGTVDRKLIDGVAGRVEERAKANKSTYHAMCLINHQKNTPIDRRKVAEAIPADVSRLAGQKGIALITAIDLASMVRGVLELEWDNESIGRSLLQPGRQGVVPTVLRQIGTCNHFYDRRCVISICLHADETVKVDDMLDIRLPMQYHEEKVISLQVDGKPVSKAVGPCQVGVKTTLSKSGFRVGQPVFARIM